MNLKTLKILSLFLLSFVLMSGIIDLGNLFNYSISSIPETLDGGIDSAPFDNLMDDKIATLGRVLFYDKQLSSNNSVSCANCHEQAKAFGLEALQGTGANGMTLRRPMRLLNLRIYRTPFKGLFWDERASSLEDLATQPIKDHIEMGYSGLFDGPDINDLIWKLETIDYYNELFSFAYGNNTITEEKIAKALAQFIRSIESYDSKFDVGFAMVEGTHLNENINLDFPNFTTEENLGKTLFTTDAIKDAEGARIGGGVGCFHCHKAPSFTFAPESGNNGIITEIEGSEILTITKAPSLRDLFGPNGSLNGPLFHNGEAITFDEVLDHYNDIDPTTPMLDNRIDQNGIPLNLTMEERQQLEAFVHTLTGSDIYTNEKWSNPFDGNNEIEIVGGTINITNQIDSENAISVYPNPARDYIRFEALNERQNYFAEIFSMNGQKIWQGKILKNEAINIKAFMDGKYSITLFNKNENVISTQHFIKL